MGLMASTARLEQQVKLHSFVSACYIPALHSKSQRPCRWTSACMQLNIETHYMVCLTVQLLCKQAPSVWKFLSTLLHEVTAVEAFVVWAAAGFQGPTGPTGCLRRNAPLSKIAFLAFLCIIRYWSSVMTGILHFREFLCALTSFPFPLAELHLLWQASLEALAPQVICQANCIHITKPIRTFIMSVEMQRRHTNKA